MPFSDEKTRAVLSLIKATKELRLLCMCDLLCDVHKGLHWWISFCRAGWVDLLCAARLKIMKYAQRVKGEVKSFEGTYKS